MTNTAIKKNESVSIPEMSPLSFNRETIFVKLTMAALIVCGLSVSGGCRSNGCCPSQNQFTGGLLVTGFQGRIFGKRCRHCQCSSPCSNCQSTDEAKPSETASTIVTALNTADEEPSSYFRMERGGKFSRENNGELLDNTQIATGTQESSESQDDEFPLELNQNRSGMPYPDFVASNDVFNQTDDEPSKITMQSYESAPIIDEAPLSVFTGILENSAPANNDVEKSVPETPLLKSPVETVFSFGSIDSVETIGSLLSGKDVDHSTPQFELGVSKSVWGIKQQERHSIELSQAKAVQRLKAIVASGERENKARGLIENKLEKPKKAIDQPGKMVLPIRTGSDIAMSNRIVIEALPPVDNADSRYPAIARIIMPKSHPQPIGSLLRQADATSETKSSNK